MGEPAPAGEEWVVVSSAGYEEWRRRLGGDAVAAGMLILTANMLLTGGPIEEDQLRAAVAHFRGLAEMCVRSGPRFGGSHREAINLHNLAVRRLRESSEEKKARERREAEARDGLTELELE
jgi:hypothetical protein